MTVLVLSVIGDDRTGLVDALAAPIAAAGGSWQRSSLARLSGQFAGIVEVSIAAANVVDLRARLAAVEAEGLLRIQLTESVPHDVPAASSRCAIHLVGSDRPGIVAEIARALATHQVSIEELETTSSSAPMSGEALFEATATLRIPPHTRIDEVRVGLEDIANELMVDLDFGDLDALA